ncbi:hypothetical protein AcV7_006806 [Taiwanofungus camphoratus]|nr:hypothetical protein AcV7_006806 [Antrodia cinnamomea]
MTTHTGVGFTPTARHDTYLFIHPAKANLGGRVALVTGASRGIGKAIALAFAQAGVSGLVLLARSELKAVETACIAAQRPGQALEILTLAVDTTSASQVADAAEQVKAKFGRLDVLVNNAGCMEPFNLIADSDPDEWWKVWTVNVRGTYHVTRSFLPLLIDCGGDKTIVNMTSIGAHLLGTHVSAYQTTKLAIMRFTELIVAEYSEKGVLAYAVHPGAVATDMSATMPASMQHLVVDTLELASHTVAWLVQERREWLAGRYVSCQWDMNELLEKKQEIIDGDKLKVRMIV